MINLDEAMKIYFSGIGEFSKEERVEQVYIAVKDSIGSCGECSRWNKGTGECYGCIGYDCACEADFYCANFERKEPCGT